MTIDAESGQGVSLYSSVEIKNLPKQCGFCLIPETKTTEYFKSMHGNSPHTLNIPGVPDNFTVLQDLVPLAEQGGHLLLMPNTHFISLASVEDQEGLATSREAVIYSLRKYFPKNPFFAFEHGPGFIEGEPVACGGCHLDHAHGHIMILPEGSQLKSIQNRMEQILADNGWEDSSSQALPSDRVFTNIHKFAEINPYLHIGMINHHNTFTSFTYPQKTRLFEVPSQLLRAVVSEVIYGQTDPTYWHWRDIQMGIVKPVRIQQIKRDVIKFREITGF